MTGIDPKTATDVPVPGRWVVVANVARVVTRPDEEEIVHTGTKRFRNGAKVYVVAAYAGMCDNVVVVGQHRRSRRWLTVVMPAKHLHGFRPNGIYSPSMLRRLDSLPTSPAAQIKTQEQAIQWARVLPFWGPPTYGRMDPE